MSKVTLKHLFAASGLLLALCHCAIGSDGAEPVADVSEEARALGGPCGGIEGAACSGDQFCSFQGGTCGANDATGQCSSKPEVCPYIYAPVCGCDGHTYANHCEASRAATSIAYRGECHQ